MRIFNLDKQYNIVCNSVNTRSGFKHVATLHRNGYSIANAKKCYINRTWERFTYESVLIKMINNYFKDKEQEQYLAVIAKEA